MPLRICPHCSEQFKTKSSVKKYCSSNCQLENSKLWAWEKVKTIPKNRVQQLYSMAKNRSKTKKLKFNITPEYLLKIYNEQNGCCAISGELFDLSRPEFERYCRWNAPSLDRIIPSKGYTKNNIRFVCYQINVGIQHYGAEHFLNLCKQVVDYNGGIV